MCNNGRSQCCLRLCSLVSSTQAAHHMALQSIGLSKVGTWVTLPPRGIGIILLSIIAGFSVASLILKPWSKMTNWSEINQSSYRVAMEDGMMGSTGSIGSGLKERSRHSTSSLFFLLVLLRNLHNIHRQVAKQ